MLRWPWRPSSRTPVWPPGRGASPRMTDPVRVAGQGLAVDQAAAHLEPVDGLDDRWIAQRPGQQTYADRVVADHQAEAIVLDLVHPARAGSVGARRRMEGKIRRSRRDADAGAWRRRYKADGGGKRVRRVRSARINSWASREASDQQVCRTAGHASSGNRLRPRRR
jgi:hypothetical protein